MGLPVIHMSGHEQMFAGAATMHMMGCRWVMLADVAEALGYPEKVAAQALARFQAERVARVLKEAP